MVLNTLQGIYTTFGAEGGTFLEANNRLGSDVVGTSNRPLLIYANPSISSVYYNPLSGQVFTENEGIKKYSVFQPLFRFEIPLDKIKNLISAKIAFSAERINSSNASISRFNIRVVDSVKRYDPRGMSTLALLGSFSNNSYYQEIIIPNPSSYINQYSIRFAFSEVDQENNIQRLSVDSEYAMDLSVFRNVGLVLEYDAYNIDQLSYGTGFKHYEMASSGLAERPGKTGSTVFIKNSGFMVAPTFEDVSSVILYPGSGHQLRAFDLCCGDRCLRYPNVASTKRVELDVPTDFPGSGQITVNRWNSAPVAGGTNFNSVGTLSHSGGIIDLTVEPGKSWFHFTSYNPEQNRVQAIRLAEKSSKLMVVSF